MKFSSLFKIFKTSIYLFAVVLVSCNPVRKIIKVPIKEHGVDYLFENLKKNEFKFDWISANFNADIEIDNKKNSFRGILRIKKDSVIWISITPGMGIEVGRLMVTNDSVKLINRLNSTYFIGNFNHIKKILNADIDFDMFQSLLTGNDFAYYENGVAGKFKANIENQQYHLTTAERSKLRKYIKSTADADRLFIQNILLSPDNFKITGLSIKEKKLKDDNRKLVVTYDDFRQLDNQLFPYHLNVDVFDKDKDIKLSINFTKVVSNVPQSFPFNISTKYQKIEK